MNIRLPNAPLTDEQLQQLNNLLQGLEGWQVDWLSGYLSGYRAAQGGTAATEAAPSLPDQTIKLTVLYGSQTGNTETVAGQLAEKAKSSGIEVKLWDMAEYKPRELKNEQYLAVLTSTHGEGEPPDNAMDLYEFLGSRKAPGLKGLKYSVLSLGDSSYEYFCQTGKDFDERLQKLGATAVIPRVDCDVDYDDLAEKWIAEFIESLTSSMQASAAPPSASAAMSQLETSVQYDRKHPFSAPLLENQILSGRGSSKEVRHIEISLEGSGLHYQPGDALGVYPQNDPVLVSMLIDALGFDADTPVELEEQTETLTNALMHHREITVLTRPLVEKWAELAQSDELNKLMESKAAVTEWIRGRDVLDLVQSYPLADIDANGFIKLLRKLPPRLYSIASSQAAVDEEVHITVATVRYNAHNRERGGVASTWLADRLAEDATIPVYIDPNKNFKLPADDDAPIIMIGPGTGVAPFRSFMQEREERGARGRNWLFFGDQHFLTDFLYQTEWLAWRKSGLLTHLDVAFSRDQTEKIYVQHRIREKSIEIWNWLQEGAYLYVCGDADNMAPDVNEALIDIISQQGNKSREDATEYLRQLTRDKRYQRDVY
ncbi:MULTISPECIES: assimilatory sulfite reductase (NADPH) flavoprotein subunit [unclassified Methylophaga]|jgi:sulfite reductase (NADPH) flavoprotein alpha-component|uniref:assimilatory sulfite reductase (NADPH) flavoprotein subunit n=2 Tax=Methylophaga TaxID=40222 RepID=UPI000C387B8F|nr:MULTISPECIES: assimilatory sulfite reductase (NADPH) flavoprotein subunit [unclassified Methylophaga]MAL48760.1 sulfite reductase [NADPH] flavoprotein alpha-component [Methylophaga sp.]MBP25010.1 sulfite reductase [NADPH] flavoprotein alpha-component [Methylophaga sp.]HCC81661.1 sulfite reductase [NADPH] flavoprotein alpha-component [Methylophaga sp.]|tara:strand:+ start:3902 stop:5701 length:1800 start_codon:yes stop_codon:yes gene_type:complete